MVPVRLVSWVGAGRSSVHSRLVKAFRRGLMVAIIAVAVGAVVRLRGSGGTPPTGGGWRELEGPDLR